MEKFNTPLSVKDRQTLKGLAHGLKPVAMIGNAGLSDNVVKEIDAALTSHALIKVRVLGDDREARAEMYAAACAALNCEPVQHLGKIFILYRFSEALEAKQTAAAQRARKAAMPKEYVSKKRLSNR